MEQAQPILNILLFPLFSVLNQELIFVSKIFLF